MAPATQGTFAKMSLRHCLLLVVVLMLAEYFYRPVSAWTPSEELQPYAYMRALLTPNVGDPGNQCPAPQTCTGTNYNSVGGQPCFNKDSSPGCVAKDATVPDPSVIAVYKLLNGVKTELQPTSSCCADQSPTKTCYACTEGEDLELTVALQIQSTATQRYKATAYLGYPWVVPDKNGPATYSCTVQSLDPNYTKVAKPDGSCCGGIEKNSDDSSHSYDLTVANVRVTCGAAGKVGQCAKQSLGYAVIWDENCKGSCVKLADTTKTGFSWVNVSPDPPKCVGGTAALTNLVSRPANPITAVSKDSATSPDVSNICPGGCVVSQGNTFYWVVQVTIDSDSTVQSITLTDLLRVSDINKVLGNGDVKWSYTGSGSAVTDSDCAPTAVPASASFVCQTATGVGASAYTGGVFTFKIPMKAGSTASALGEVKNTASVYATVGSSSPWDPISDDAKVTIIAQSETPATLSVTKTAKDANSGDCVGTSNNPCQLAPGVTKFSYTLTGTVKNSGQNNNGDIGFKSITLRDTLPSGFELDQLGATCDATKAGSSTPCSCNQDKNDLYCTTSSTTPFLKDDTLAATIRVIAPPGAAVYKNSATASGVTGTGGQTSTDPADQYVQTSLAPTFIASKTANRADKVTECGSAGSCKILDGEDFFWLVKATVTVGMYSAFTITDTVDDQYFVLGSNAPCKGGLTDTTVSPSGAGLYTCTVSGPVATGDAVELWIPLKAKTRAAGSPTTKVDNVATISGTPLNAINPQTPPQTPKDSLSLVTPAFGVTKTPYLDNGGKPADNPCGDAQTPCSVGNGNKFWWLIKATITAGEYTSFSFSDVMDPDIISAGVSTCSTSQGDKSDGTLTGSSYTCTVAASTGKVLAVGDFVEYLIPVMVKDRGQGVLDKTVINTGRATGTPRIGAAQSVDGKGTVVLTATNAPAYTSSKTAYTMNLIAECGSTPTKCSISGDTRFYWVTKAQVSQGQYTSFTISDTIATEQYTNDDGFCRVNGNTQNNPAAKPTGNGLYSCTLSGPFSIGNFVELWIPVKTPVMPLGSSDKPISNSADVTGVFTGTGSPQSDSPSGTITVQGRPYTTTCDAAIFKTVLYNPVYVGGSSQPPTTEIVTTVNVLPNKVCSQVRFTDTLPPGLSLTQIKPLLSGGSCSTGGGNQYTCTWPATTGPATFTVDTLLTVTVPVSSAPVDLTDTAVLDADENPNNNQASAVVNVRPVSPPDLRVTKVGPGAPVPINQPFPFYVSAGVNNGVTITELTLKEQLSGVDGAYFVEPYPDGCTPSVPTASKPTLVNCKWTGSVVSDRNNLKFMVMATKPGTVNNTATVSSPGATDKSATDTAVICDSDCPSVPPKATVTKTVDTNNQPYVAPGTEFTYTIVATLTQGPTSGTTLAVFDYVDPAVTFTSVVAPATGCILSAHAMTCQVASGTTITLKAKADTTGTFINTAQVTVGNSLNSTTVPVTVWRPTCGDVKFGGEDDPYTGCPSSTPYDPNNADKYPPGITTCCNLNPQDVPTINILKTSSADEVSPGQTVDWTIAVENQAGLTPVTAESVQVVDTLPAGVRPAPSSITITGGTNADKCTVDGRKITCNLNNMGAGTVKFIKVPVTVLKVSGTARKKLTNTATVTCKVGGKDNPACKDTTSDDIFVTPVPPQTTMVDVDKTATPKSGPKDTDFTFKIEVKPAEAGKTASDVVLTDKIDKDLRNVKLLTTLGGKCKFDQGSYTVTCTWKKLKAKQTVRIKATGVKPGPTTNTAVVNFNGGTATSSVDIMVNADPLGSCCDGSYTCTDSITQADCKAKGAGAVWSDWSASPPVTCSSSAFCKGACCSSGVGSCNCPYCHQTAKSECSKTNDKWVPGADCNSPTTCPSACTSKCQSCSGPGDSSCCPGLACVCSGNKFGPKYVCAAVNPYDPNGNWIYIGTPGKNTPKSVNDNVKTDLLAPLGGTCGRVAAGLQCAGPAVDCVLDGKSEAGVCKLHSTLTKDGDSCSGQGQCVGGSRCVKGVCQRATCPATSGCGNNDLWCIADYTFGCQVFWAHTMSSFDQI